MKKSNAVLVIALVVALGVALFGLLAIATAGLWNIIAPTFNLPTITPLVAGAVLVLLWIVREVFRSSPKK